VSSWPRSTPVILLRHSGRSDEQQYREHLLRTLTVAKMIALEEAWPPAVMPCFRALNREAALPFSVVGPVDFSALRRLAAIWRSEATDNSFCWGSGRTTPE
jgi:hypothetical protein